MNTPSANKKIVARFNREVIEQGDMHAFNELVASDFVNTLHHQIRPKGPMASLHSLQTSFVQPFLI